ncbi:MAG: CDP-alcohol phosphatidyltransferase family protein [Patescibacteria group bacterium]|jgi:phosphatidylglycerophosphate synthase
MLQNNEKFAGDKKVGQSLLTPWEMRLVAWAVPKVPLFIRTYHLTLATIPISLGIVIFSYMARFDINWLWLVSLLIAAQWVTDGLDGAVGRAREEGFIKWGYYMDHFLDYIFLCAILIGYMLLIPDRFKDVHFFVLAIFGAFMVNSYLAFAASNKFRIAYLGIGPTEIRLVFIFINTLIILFGRTYMVAALPYVLIFSFFGLCVVVYKTQKEIWDMDMAVKRQNQIESSLAPGRRRQVRAVAEKALLEKAVED